jgi:DNA-binding NtrC family response regulator
MNLSSPTLLFSAREELETQLRSQIQEGPTYLVRAPHWEAFSRLVAQLVFGVVVVDFRLLTDREGTLDPAALERLIEEAAESNAQVRLLVLDVPTEELFETLLTAGVHDVLLEPVALRELVLRLERALDAYAWLAQRNYYVGKSGHIFRVEDIVGDSPGMLQIFEQVRRLAPSRTPVLITGETGSGKGPSSRSTAPPCRIPCSSPTSSDTRRAPSPARPASGSAASSRPTAAPSSWTKWER